MDGFLRNASYLIHDRAQLFTAPSALLRFRSGRRPTRKAPACWTFPLRLTKAWTALLKSSGVKFAPIPAHSPNCNRHAERFVKTIRGECLDHFVSFGERHLRHLIKQVIEHYLMERYHQGLSSQIIKPKTSPSNDNAMLGSIECRSRLGGLLKYYYRQAA